MIITILLTILFLIMLTWPFLLSMIFDAKDKIRPLYVGSENIKNPRFFAVSFANKMHHALQEAEPDSTTINLSHEEPLLRGCGEPFVNQEIDVVVYEQGDFVAKASTFSKEVYTTGDVDISGESEIRALASLGYARLGDRTEIIRWLDAEKGVRVGANCDLGMSLTSKGPIVLGRGSHFHRLFGSMIYAGANLPTEAAVRLHPLVRGLRVREPIRQIDRVEQGEVVSNTIITTSSLMLGKGCEVKGDIKSEGDIRIMADAVVCGGVFADGGIVIEAGANVQGDVFSQEDIMIARNAVVGVRGCIRSAVARKHVYLQEGAFVYGYIGSEDLSFVVDENAFRELSAKRY